MDIGNSLSSLSLLCGSDNISTLFDYIFKYSRVLQLLNA